MEFNIMKESKSREFENTTINVLGTEYKVLYKSYDEYADFRKQEASGFCDVLMKEIIICQIWTCPEYLSVTSEAVRNNMKEILRHEITHAFLHESGLGEDSHTPSSGWAVDEEIVDWFAIQSPKIYKVFEEVGAI